MKTFNICNKNYYAENSKLYKSNKLTLKENQIYCLVGCNGIGKSTLIHQIIEDNKNSLSKTAWDMCKNYQYGDLRGIFDNNKKQCEYDEYYFSANRKTRVGKSEDDFITHDLFSSFQSTGEQNVFNFVPIFQALNSSLQELKNKTYYIFFDDFDVGTSIDILAEYVLCIKKLEEKLIKNNITYYIVLTTNAYELAKNFKCIDCVTLEEKTFSDYNDYANYVKETREYKDKRDEKE